MVSIDLNFLICMINSYRELVNPIERVVLVPSNFVQDTSCISLSVAVPNRNFMAEPIPLTTPRLLRCVSHHEMGMVIKSSAIFNRDRAIAVPMLGVSCLIMFVVKIMSWSRSAGNTGFVPSVFGPTLCLQVHIA